MRKWCYQALGGIFASNNKDYYYLPLNLLLGHRRAPGCLDLINTTLQVKGMEPCFSVTPTHKELKYYSNDKQVAMKRVSEIEEWVLNAPSVHQVKVKNWIALDDMDMTCEVMQDHFVMTDSGEGLSR